MLTKSDKKFIVETIDDRVDRKLSFFKDEITDHFEERFTDFKSEVLNGIDAVLGELKASREERHTLNGRQVETRETLGDHEERITTIENGLAFS